MAPSGSTAQNDAHRKYFTNKGIRITSSADAVWLCREMLRTEDAIDRDKEHFYVVHLNTRSKVTMIEVVSVGTVSASSRIHERHSAAQSRRAHPVLLSPTITPQVRLIRLMRTGR